MRRTSILILKNCISKNQRDSQQVDCTEVPCHAKDLPVSENLCILFNSKSDFSSIMGTICFNLDAVKVWVSVVLTRFHDSPRETNKPESRGGLGVIQADLENSKTPLPRFPWSFQDRRPRLRVTYPNITCELGRTTCRRNSETFCAFRHIWRHRGGYLSKAMVWVLGAESLRE